MTEPHTTAGVPPTAATHRSVGVVLALAAVVGLVASLGAWALLELIHQLQVGAFTKLPEALGYDQAPDWWPLVILPVGGLVVAFAIARLPGAGGHVPAHGLATTGTRPFELPGVLLAALGTIGLGLVLGPEAPLIALGGGLGVLGVRLLRRDEPEELSTLLGACGTFAALSLIFDSPIISAVILIEATGLGGERLPRVLVPGLLAAAIGSLISIGMGSWTGLSASAYAMSALPVPAFPRPAIGDFAWSIALAVAIAVGVFAVLRAARRVESVVTPRPFVALPIAGLIVAGLAVGFAQATDHGTADVLFSGQDALPGLIAGAGTWSIGALALVIACKGIAWSICLAGFRGGPTFPAMFLGAAVAIMASRLPGYNLTPAIAVGIGAGVASVLRLPLSAALLAIVLTAGGGAGAMPLAVIGAVAAYLATLALDARAVHPERAMPAPAPAPTMAASQSPGGHR
ncbi:MAG TPA: chloride channel protein [Baekduia sp.]|nr:chloride channel protein [Baekduia sp.]